MTKHCAKWWARPGVVDFFFKMDALRLEVADRRMHEIPESDLKTSR